MIYHSPSVVVSTELSIAHLRGFVYNFCRTETKNCTNRPKSYIISMGDYMLSGPALILLLISVIVNFLFGITVIFFEKRNPAVTWAWLVVVLLIPYFGFGFYLMVGLDARKHRTFANKNKQNTMIIENIHSLNLPGLEYTEKEQQAANQAAFSTLPHAEQIIDLMRLNMVSGGFLTGDNQIKILTEGADKFSSLLTDIRAAKSFIHMRFLFAIFMLATSRSCHCREKEVV